MDSTTAGLAKVKQFLHQHRLAVLSTASTAGQPHGAAVYYAVDEDLNFFFVTQADSRKHKYAMGRQQVALTITDATSQITVQVEGRAEVAGDKSSYDKILRALASAPEQEVPNWPPPVSKLGNSFAIVKIKPSWMRVADFSQFKHDSPAGYFTQILPPPQTPK